MARAWAVLLGTAAGFVISDLLNASGLHWLNVPVIILLAAFSLAIVMRKRS